MGIKIGILGLAGAGKDTFADFLQEALLDYGCLFTIDRYALPLKVLTSIVFNCSLDDLEDRVYKETPQHIDADWALDAQRNCLHNVLKFTDDELEQAALKHITCLEGRTFISPREFQQLFGTDVVRAVRPNAWVDYQRAKPHNAIIADVRFDNELCNFNVLVQRFDVPKPEHVSEHFAWDVQAGNVEVQGLITVYNVDVSLSELKHYAKIVAISIEAQL